MNLSIENFLFIGSILLFISIIAGRTTHRFGIPTLVLFLSIGMLAGSEGIGGIYFDDPKIAQFIGVVCLNFILFSGGLDTNWESIKPVLWQGITLSTFGVLISLFLIFVARPLSVFIGLIPFKMKTRRRWYISWVGLRGAVPVVFATYPLIAGIEKADMIFNIVFFISLTSVLIQGTTLPLVAKWLHVALPVSAKPKKLTDVFLPVRHYQKNQDRN